MNVIELCPKVCPTPFTVHSRKVYNPDESVATAWRFTLVPDATPDMPQFVVPASPVLEPMLSPVSGVDCTLSV